MADDGYVILEVKSLGASNNNAWNYHDHFTFHSNRYARILIFQNSSIPNFENIGYWENFIQENDFSDFSKTAMETNKGLQIVLTNEQFYHGMKNEEISDHSDLVRLREKSESMRENAYLNRFLFFADGL